MEARGVPKTLWSANINPLLNSNCKQALLSLLSEEQGSWDSVEHALLLTLGAKYSLTSCPAILQIRQDQTNLPAVCETINSTI